jgi:hypothetical protein
MTIEAVRASIKKWEKNARVKNTLNAKTGVYDCPLCTIYFIKDCIGCPIYKKTGHAGCKNTPYEEAYEAFMDRDAARLRKHAREEVEFLKSIEAAMLKEEADDDQT